MRIALVVLGGLLVLGLAMDIAFAQSSSNNYQIKESFVGPGGQLDSSSANYSARASLGDTGVGYGESTDYGAWSGYTTTDVPFLEFSVNTTSVDLGIVTTSAATTGSATFSVRTYLSSGYAVTTSSPGMQNYIVTLTNLASQTASSAGTEQFGINLVANTSPVSVGSNPVQVPDGTFSFGTVATGYNTTNVYKYVDADIIAESAKSSGQTDFTITYLMNISDITPGGVYVMTHSVIATPTF